MRFKELFKYSTKMLSNYLSQNCPLLTVSLEVVLSSLIQGAAPVKSYTYVLKENNKLFRMHPPTWIV